MPLILNKDKYKGMTQEEMHAANREKFIKTSMEEGLTRETAEEMANEFY